MNASALAFAESGFPIIPVRLSHKGDGWRKEPMAKWDLATTDEATIVRWWRNYPDALPGIPLARMGWAVVDADREEGKKKVTGIGCLGPHSAIDTPSGGKHLVFAQPDPPITKLRWCDDVEVLGTSCLLTCYDLEELKFPHVAPRAILPKMFWQPREGQGRRERTLIKNPRPSRAADAVEVADLTAALRQLDPVDFREYAAWFALMTGACWVGISERDWVDWSTADPDYAADGPIIRKMWRKLNPQHGGAFWAALKAGGIRLRHKGRVINERPLTAAPTRNLRARLNSLLRELEREPTERMLFSTSCRFAEVIAELGKPQPSIAAALIESTCKVCGLWRQLGAEECRRSIANGLRWIEEKLLQEEPSTAPGKFVRRF